MAQISAPNPRLMSVMNPNQYAVLSFMVEIHFCLFANPQKNPPVMILTAHRIAGLCNMSTATATKALESFCQPIMIGRQRSTLLSLAEDSAAKGKVYIFNLDAYERLNGAVGDNWQTKITIKEHGGKRKASYSDAVAELIHINKRKNKLDC